MYNRTFHIYGSCSNDAAVDVYVNDVLTHSGPINQNKYDPFGQYGTEIYNFETDYRAHGFSRIKIIVTQGNAIVGRHRISYPSAVASGVRGTLYITQPIREPKFLTCINGVMFDREQYPNSARGEWTYPLNAGDTFEYYHLYYNGPLEWRMLLTAAELEKFKSARIINEDNVVSLEHRIFDYDYKKINTNELVIIAQSAMVDFLKRQDLTNKCS